MNYSQITHPQATTGGKGQNFVVAANTLFHNSATGKALVPVSLK